MNTTNLALTVKHIAIEIDTSMLNCSANELPIFIQEFRNYITSVAPINAFSILFYVFTYYVDKMCDTLVKTG